MTGRIDAAVTGFCHGVFYKSSYIMILLIEL